MGLTWQLSSGKISLGVFTALVVSTGTMLELAGTFSYLAQDFRRNTLILRHYFVFMNLPEVQVKSYDEGLTTARIEFDNVSFKYPGSERYVLNNLSFIIEPGEKIAMVGANGAGKSTIIKLMLGLYKPSKGKILINGKNISELSTSYLRKVFSVVFQDYGCYHFTIRENIAFGDLSKLCNDEELYKALRLAQADEIINLDTPLGKLEEGGIDFSGGEWQRMAIARGCISNSQFIILDEPTASLDPIAESKLYQRFSDVIKDRGCILISHRLGSVKIADRIIVIKDGCVFESGTHNQLMEEKGYYAEMFEKQSSWFLERM